MERLHDQLRRLLPGITLPDIGELLARDVLRQVIKANRPKLFSEVARVLWKADLEGIAGGGEDEYETEATGILFGLSNCHSTGEIQKLVSEVFSRSGFSGELSRYHAISIDIAALVKQHGL
jgi:hypothetical protein